MKSSTTNAETLINEEVFYEVFESFQGESSSSSLNDDVQQSPEEVIIPQTNTQSISNNMIPNVDKARDVNPIRTLEDYSKPSNEGYRNTIKLLVGNNMNLYLKCGLVSRTYYKKSLIMNEMTNKIDIVLKAITNRIARTLPSDTVKNPKVSTSPILSARSYPTKEPQCSTHIHGSNKDDEGIEWLDVKEPLDLVDTSKESVYESLIKEIPKCSFNYEFRIKKGDPRNLKIPCMIGHKFIANAYIDVDLPMNIMSLAYYNSIRKNGYEYRGRNFVGLGRDMHVFVGNLSYVIYFTILENFETNIDSSLSHVICGRPFTKIACLAINRKHGLMTYTNETKKITFKTPYKDPERSELSSEGHDLLSSRVILNEDDYDRGCRKPSDLKDRFYRDTIELGPEYVTGMDDEREVTNTSNGLAAIQAQVNNLGKEIKKVNERVYAAQVGRYKVVALGFYQRDNENTSYQERRQPMEESLNKFMAKSAKRHDEHFSLIKEIRASMDAAIRKKEPPSKH
nr:protein kinase-like domain, concanavalin A-like lectin/glucanase domain protein [Tanacetum cinerariifolium]